MDKYEAVKHLIEQGKDATLEDGVVMLRSRATARHWIENTRQ